MALDLKDRKWLTVLRSALSTEGLAAGVQHVLRLWGRDLTAVLRAARAGMARWRGRRVTITVTGDTLSLFLGAPGTARPLGTVSSHAEGSVDCPPPLRRRLTALRRRGVHVTVVLGAESGGLLRAATLPKATERHLGQVLTHQLSRLTPYTPDRAVFDYRVSGHPDAGRVSVDLAVLPRPVYDRALNLVAALGLQPNRITLSDGTGLAPFNLMDQDDPPAAFVAAPPRPWLGAVTGLLAVFLLINLGGKALLLGWLTWQLPEARAAAQEAAGLRREVEALGGSSRFIAEAKVAAPSATLVVDALSRTLPDGTWLTSLELNEGSVQIQGNSRDATALLPLLEGEPAFEDPSFSGAVSRSGSGGERFQIRMQAVSGSGGAS